MRTSRYRGWLICGLILLGQLLSPGVAVAADFLDFYKTGLVARDDGDWEMVEEMMRRAIELKPEEKRKLLIRRSSYFPHFYFGLARYRQGDCAGALEAWAESESQAAIVGQPEFFELSQMQEDCEENGTPTLITASAESARQESQSQEGAEPEARSGAESSSPGSTSSSTSPQGNEEESSQEKPRKKRTAKENVRTGQRVVEKGKDPARKGLEAVGRLAPEGSKLGRAADRGKATVDLAEAGTDVVDLVLSAEERLRAAIDAYFSGKPRRTLELLGEADLSDPRARTQVYLFRAAANFRLHRMAGNDKERLAAARKNAKLFRGQDWTDDFPAELFDPHFVRFVKGGS
ncbi:MAG: hypothetical protein SX243_07105 [Acidobacteriota bacterium]|nr:hypothetical protein [Acidobacteriota bacterium]